MIDTEAMARDFIERRKAFNEELRLNQSGKYTYKDLWSGAITIKECKPFRLKEEPMNETPQLLYISYANGRGGMVIDQEELMKLPKGLQAKIFRKLHKFKAVKRMENNLELFQKNTLAVFEELKAINDQKKALEAKETQAKEIIKAACDEYCIKSFKNDIVTISNVDEKTTVSLDVEALKVKEYDYYLGLRVDYPIDGIDIEAFKKDCPDEYEELLKDYPLTKTTAGYVKFTFKK